MARPPWLTGRAAALSCHPPASGDEHWFVQGHAPFWGWTWAGCGKGALIKAWPLIPTWDISKIKSVLRTCHEFSWGFYWDLITAQLLPLLSPFPFPCPFLSTGFDHKDPSTASCTLIPSKSVSQETQPATASVCANERANLGCFYIPGIHSRTYSIAWLERSSSPPSYLFIASLGGPSDYLAIFP